MTTLLIIANIAVWAALVGVLVSDWIKPWL